MGAVEHESFPGVYWVEFEDKTRKLATVNQVRGVQVYGEQLVRFENVEYRVWNPYRSKLAAAILRGIKEVPITTGTRLLYLGAASGTTVSHVSDLIGAQGVVYCVEFSSRPMRDLLFLCERRANAVPILADATRPEDYRTLLGKIDVIYQDIAQPIQTEILLRNANMFLPKNGYALLVLKARSIDITKEPQEIFRDEVDKLEKDFEVLDSRILDPYDIDHAIFLLQKQGKCREKRIARTAVGFGSRCNAPFS